MLAAPYTDSCLCPKQSSRKLFETNWKSLGVKIAVFILGIPKPVLFRSEVHDRKGEGFLLLVAAERWSLARPRPALENLPRRKPRRSWIRLWGKCADGWRDGCIRSAADGAPG